MTFNKSMLFTEPEEQPKIKPPTEEEKSRLNEDFACACVEAGVVDSITGQETGKWEWDGLQWVCGTCGDVNEVE